MNNQDYVGPTYNLQFNYKLTFTEKLTAAQRKCVEAFVNSKIAEALSSPSLITSAQVGEVSSLSSGLDSLLYDYCMCNSNKFDVNNCPQLMHIELNTNTST